MRLATRGGPFAGFDARTLRRRAEKMLRHLALGGVEVSVALVDDEAIRALNRDFRGTDRSTDVLAFAMREGEPMGTGPGELELLGDVVISAPTACRQGAARGRTPMAEMTMLLAHGILHLLGYDHRDDAEEREMKARTAELEAAATRRSAQASRRRDRTPAITTPRPSSAHVGASPKRA